MICAYQENVEIPSTTLGKYVIAPRAEGWGPGPIDRFDKHCNYSPRAYCVAGFWWFMASARGWDRPPFRICHPSPHAPRGAGAPGPCLNSAIPFMLKSSETKYVCVEVYYYDCRMITSSTWPPLHLLPHPSFNGVKLRYNDTTPFSWGRKSLCNLLRERHELICLIV